MKVREQVARFIAEDVGQFDLTSNIMVDETVEGTFYLNAREPIVLAGIDVARIVFEYGVPGVRIETYGKDGSHVAKGGCLMKVSGKARDILIVERTALNILQHMSGIATETAKYVKAIEGTGCQLIDTRKTTPGLRMFEKHAVVCGGGRNHRLALDSGILVKDNHIAVFGSMTAAIKRARSMVPVLSKVEVECDNLDQVKEALDAGAEMILLDNMEPDMMREAVKIVAGRIPLEASGGINLDTVRAKAESGVNFISVGRITHSSRAVDIGLDDARRDGG